MIFTVIRQTADTVITVSQNLDPQLVVLLLKHHKSGGYSVFVSLVLVILCTNSLKLTNLYYLQPFLYKVGIHKYVKCERWLFLLTAASLSKRAKSSLSSLTSSFGVTAEDSRVKPTMSAKRILQREQRRQINTALCLKSLNSLV